MTPQKNLAHLMIMIAIGACTSREVSQTQNDSTSNQTITDTLPEGADAQGDFDGDGVVEAATVKLTTEGELQSKPWIYTIEFSNPKIVPFSFASGTEFYQILNEGTLNNIPGDELSVLTQGGTMGLTQLQAYSFSNAIWGYAMDGVSSYVNLPDSIPLQDIILKVNSDVFFYDYVNNNMGGVEESESASEPDVYFKKTKAKLYTTIEPLPFIYNEDTDVEGDFDGDANYEIARLIVMEEGSPEEQKPWSSSVQFSNRKIKPFTFTSERYEGEIISEGDVNNNRGSELSVLTGTNMTNYNYLVVYTYTNGKWEPITNDEVMVPDILPDGLSLGDIIFEENGELFYYDSESIQEFKDTQQKSSLKKVKMNLK
jgi:hypothetical protein